MKNNFLVIASIALLTVFSTNVWAQMKNSATPNDAKVKNILNSALSKIKAAPAISFDATVVNKDPDKKEVSRQKVKVLLSGNKYRITIDDMVVCCDDKAVYSIDNSAKEVTVNAISDSETDIFNPAKLLKNNEKNFRPKLIREENNQYVVDMTPIKTQNYHKIRLLINKSSYQITKVEVYNYNSSRNECTISQYKTNAKASDSDFTFDAAKNKGYEVIDMR
ncbi:MAG: outer membrane lipoprotein carrier protein LolA [Bacteroidales bacterium]|nr:outer membrane lipoprotein carrier protein LolA [Bacteroidales bacterium]